jgi:hypothetical protein
MTRFCWRPLPYPGNLGHTAFATSCTSGSSGCIAPTADPGGAWTRSMLDLYLAGVTDGFV